MNNQTSPEFVSLASSISLAANSVIWFLIIVNVYVVVVLCGFGIMGNAISILILGRDEVIKRTTRLLLQALALTDIMYLVLCLFYQAINTMSKYTQWFPCLDKYYPHIDPWIWPLASIAQTSTVWLVTLLTADRYMAICHPLRARQYCTVSRVRKSIAMIWLVAIVYNIPRFFERSVIVYDDGQNMTMAFAETTALRKNSYYNIIYKTCLFFVARFLVPVGFLLFFNIRLIQAIQASRKFYKNLSVSRFRTTQPGDDKYNLTLLVIVFVFLLLASPDIVLRIWMSLHALNSSVFSFNKRAVIYINAISNLCLTMNSCANFIIYCLVAKRFRKLALRMFCGSVKSYVKQHSSKKKFIHFMEK